MNKKNLIIFIIMVLVVAGGVYYFSFQKGYKVGYQEGVEIGKASVKAEAGAVVANPLEKMPETNPFEGVTNPFKELYKNPFK